MALLHSVARSDRLKAVVPVVRWGRCLTNRGRGGSSTRNRCGGVAAATDNRMTRMRQVSASTKTTNLSRQALEPKKRYLDERPARGAGRVLFFGAPWSGFVERPWIRRSVFLRIDRRRFSRPLWVVLRRTSGAFGSNRCLDCGAFRPTGKTRERHVWSGTNHRPNFRPPDMAGHSSGVFASPESALRWIL